MIEKLTDQELITRIKNGEHRYVDHIYRRYRESYIAWASGTFQLSKTDILEIYQDSVIALFENIINGKLDELRHQIKTYLFSIAKYKIYKKHKNKIKETGLGNELIEGLEDKLAIEEEADEKDQERLDALSEALNELGEECQKILKAFYYRGLSINKIATDYQYKNSNVVKSQKYKCMKRLKNIIYQKHPETL